MNINVNVKKLSNGAIIPTQGTAYAAGFDLYAHMETGRQDIPAGETRKIGTGLCMEIPEGFVGEIYARSGLATKRGLRPANCVGIIDPDYRGEIIVALHNDSAKCETIHEGDRIAQIIFRDRITATFNEVDELPETVRGEGGFGSTGVSA